MANEILTDEDLLKQLSVPDLSTGEPRGVSGFEDFARMVTLSEGDFNKYVVVLYDSLADVPSDLSSRISDVLSDTLKEVATKRSEALRFRSTPTNPGLVRPASTREGDAAAAYNATVLGAHTLIGPVPIDNEMPVVDVEINESYDVEPIPTINSRTDPVVKGNKNDVSISITLQVPGHRMNNVVREDGSIQQWGLRGLLASLRIAPVCEIVSPAIIPVFVNNILTPELFKQIRQEVAASRPKTKKELRDLMESGIKHGLRDNVSTMDRPPNAPTLEQIKDLPSAVILQDQGTYPSWGHPELGFVSNSPIDGDTVDLSNGDKVRLIGINTPEIRSHGNETEGQINAQSIQPGGVEATNFLAQYVGQTVYIEYGQDAVDKYGRKLAYLYTEDGKQINLQIAKSKRWDPNAPSSPGIVSLPGAMVPYAKLLTYYPNVKYRATFEAALAENYARSVGEFVEMLSSLNGFLDYMDEEGELKDAAVLNSGADTSVSVQMERLRKGSSIAVACAFRGAIVETMEGKTNTFLVKLVFTKYNDNAWYPGKLMYRNALGDATANPMDCPWIERLARETLMNDRLAGVSGQHYMEPFVAGKEGDSPLIFTWEDPLSTSLQTYRADPSRFTVENVRAQMTMKASSLPLQGGPYPVAQYMGESNMIVRIRATITDPLELAKLHEVKAELDKINYVGPAPEVRKPGVTIENNLLNFLGARDFVIAGITTRTDNQANRWDVDVTLVESRISFSDVEGVSVSTSERLQVHDARLIWNRMYELLSAYEVMPSRTAAISTPVDPNDPGSSPMAHHVGRRVPPKWPGVKKNTTADGGLRSPRDMFGYKVPQYDSNRPPKPWELDSEGLAAYVLVFGDPANFGSVLHPNIVAATWYYLTQKKNRDGSLSRWDTSPRADASVSQVMDGIGGEASGTGRVGVFNSRSILKGGQYDPMRLLFCVNRGLIEDDQFSEGYVWPAFRKVKSDNGLNVYGTGRYNIVIQGGRFLNVLGSNYRAGAFFTKEFWDAYFTILMEDLIRPDQNIADPAWTSDDISAARSYLFGIVNTGYYENFPSIAGEMRSIDGETVETSIPMNLDAPRPGEANHADVTYPTYATMFSNKGRLLTIPVNILETQIASIELWTKFAPTYADIGKKAPYSRATLYKNPEDAQNETARRLNDFVEPTLPYYHWRMRQKAVAMQEEREERFRGAMDRIRTHTIIVETSETSRGELTSWLKSIYGSPNDRGTDASYNKQRAHDLLHALADKNLSEHQLSDTLRRLNLDGPPKLVYMYSQEGQFLGTVRKNTGTQGEPFTFNASDVGERWKIFSGLGIDVFEMMHPDHSILTYRDVMNKVPDNGVGMGRMFPCYRLFFIERDRNTVYMSDDLYGLNSVVSFSIRREKYGPDTLMATISNVTDNLAFEEIVPPGKKSEFLSRSQQRDLGLSVDDASEPYSSRLKVRPGVDIQVRMGYGNKWTDLGIVFTGAITEVRPGKVVQIVAQSHKRELMSEVQMTYGGLNHFDIIRKILEKTEHPHLGSQARPFAYGSAYFRQLFPSIIDDKQLISQLDVWFNTSFTTAMRNVYIASNARLESGRSVIVGRGDKGLFGTAASVVEETLAQQYIDIERSGFFPGIWKGAVGGGSLGMWFGVKGVVFGAALGAVLGFGVGAVHLGKKLLYGREYYLGGTYATWIIPPQPAWDAINEVTRHRPGHIAQVVPFEHDATLFIGMPEQPYFAEQPTVRQTMEYNKKVVPLLAQTARDFRDTMIKPFLANKGGWYGAYQVSRLDSDRVMRYVSTVKLKHRDMFAPGAPTTQDLLPDAVGFVKRHPGMFGAPLVSLDDVVAFPELPTAGDSAPWYWIDRWKHNENILAKSKRMIRSKYSDYWDTFAFSVIGAQPPAGFSLASMPAPYDDFFGYWKEIGAFHPDLQKHVFYWFFGIDPQRGEISIAPVFGELGSVLLPKDNGVFKDRLGTLTTDSNDPLSFPYRTVSGILGPDSGAAAALLAHGAPSRFVGLPVASDDKRVVPGTSAASSQALVSGGIDSVSTASDLLELIRDRLSQPDAGPIRRAYDDEASVASLVRNMGGSFRYFVYFFAMYLRSEVASGNGDAIRAKVDQTMRKFNFFSLPPGYRVFSSTHYIGPREIINNGLYASMEEMSNCVLVRAPADHVEFKDSQGTVNVQYETTDWRSYPSTDGLAFNERVAKQNRKLGVAVEMNAIGPDQKFRVTLSNMAEMMRPMYRGRILIVGTDMKPHDVIYLNDTQNDLKGLLEVASVTHHFSTETGWVTEIEPHALVRANSPMSENHIAALSVYMRELYGWDDAIQDGSTIAMVALLAVGVGGLRFPIKSLGSNTLGGAVVKGSAKAFQGTSKTVQAVIRKEMGKAALDWLNRSVSTPLYHGSGASVLFGVGKGMRAAASRSPQFVKNLAAAFGRKGSAAMAFAGRNALSVRGGVLAGMFYTGGAASDLIWDMYSKSQLRSSTLPISVGVLRYRGASFTAGMEIEDEDLFSFMDSLYGVARDTRRSVEEAWLSILTDVEGGTVGGQPAQRAATRLEGR